MTSVRANSGLGRWFRERWVDISRPKEGGGFEPCGRSDTSKGRYPKCVPAATAARMSPEEIKSAIRRKRRAESSRERDGKAPIMVSTFKDGRPTKRARTFKKNKPADPQLYAKVKAEARRRFDVYPSAYANGWLVQEYKRRGGRYLRASAAPASVVLTCTSTVVFVCKSKACAPPPVGTGGSNPSGAGRAATAGSALRMSKDSRKALQERVLSEYPSMFRDQMPDGLYDDYAAVSQLYAYTGIEYQTINENLRNDEEYANSEKVQLMDRAFRNHSVELTEPITVFRGIRMHHHEDHPYEPEVGQILKDNAYMSTSAMVEEAEYFAVLGKSDTAVVMNITIPTGTRVLAGDYAEGELILDRGTSVRVTGVDKAVRPNGKIRMTIECEVVG